MQRSRSAFVSAGLQRIMTDGFLSPSYANVGKVPSTITCSSHTDSHVLNSHVISPSHFMQLNSVIQINWSEKFIAPLIYNPIRTSTVPRREVAGWYWTMARKRNFFLTIVILVRQVLTATGQSQNCYVTPCSRVVLENLIVSQLVRKFLVFYGTQRFIIGSTRVRHGSLSWATWIEATPSYPVSLKSILVLTSHLR
jgi:hypothetical protein